MEEANKEVFIALLMSLLIVLLIMLIGWFGNYIFNTNKDNQTIDSLQKRIEFLENMKMLNN